VRNFASSSHLHALARETGDPQLKLYTVLIVRNGARMRSIYSRTAAISAAFTLVFSLACGDSNGPEGEGEAQDFSGSYTLQEISQGTIGGNMTVLQGSTGTFSMTATTYDVAIDIPLGQTNLIDHGTYTAIGTATSGEFSQQSTDNPALQYQGTYSWDSTTNRLTLDTTAQGIRTVLVLQRG
jgi:hypothetical protein